MIKKREGIRVGRVGSILLFFILIVLSAFVSAADLMSFTANVKDASGNHTLGDANGESIVHLK